MQPDGYNATTTSLTGNVTNFSVNPKTIDAPQNQKETLWHNTEWTRRYGYYSDITNLKQAVDSLAMWAVGKGWETDNTLTKVMLDGLVGWGEDSFQAIMENMVIVKKINGDSYSEVVWSEDERKIYNLKPLNPSDVSHVVDNKGILFEYEIRQTDGTKKRIAKKNILHFCERRIANQIHGTSVLDSVKWMIDAKYEVMNDVRRFMHRSTVRVLYVAIDDETRMTKIRQQYAEGIKNGEVLILPMKRGDAEFQDLVAPPITAYLEWVRYIDDQLYKALGTPDAILGGSQIATEASSKVGYLTFEQPYMREQREIETDLLNQLFVRVKFNRPVSLKDDIVASEAANTGQLGFQENELETSPGRNE